MHRYTFILAIPPLAALFIFSEFFLDLIFREGIRCRGSRFPDTFSGGAFFLVAFINNNVLSGIGKPKIVTKMILIGAAANALFEHRFYSSLWYCGGGFCHFF